MSLQTRVTPVDRDNYIYMIGDIVNIKTNGIIHQVTIGGVPKWRNWTEDGSYDYIYTIIDNRAHTSTIQQTDILGIHS